MHARHWQPGWLERQTSVVPQVFGEAAMMTKEYGDIVFECDGCSGKVLIS
jgi:hypothetical protein